MVVKFMFKQSTMKTILTFALILFSLNTTFGQDNVAVSQGKVELVKSKETGKYLFTLPNSVTAEDVEKNSKYYELYFKPEFDASTHEVKIDLNENNEKTRMVIARFLSACGIQEIMIGTQNVAMTDFINNYLR